MGGCGSTGEFIHLTPDYLMHINGTSETQFGPHENVFVHEWAKLRYGVFDEYGYPGDEQVSDFTHFSTFTFLYVVLSIYLFLSTHFFTTKRFT